MHVLCALKRAATADVSDAIIGRNTLLPQPAILISIFAFDTRCYCHVTVTLNKDIISSLTIKT